jgi:hypothetical protein
MDMLKVQSQSVDRPRKYGREAMKRETAAERRGQPRRAM